ncbi:MAG: 5'/3'-nucleotidase SurE [Acidimicrobiia bacterium]
MSQGANGSSSLPLFLVVNDDGIDSEGIVELADKLSEIGNVIVAAPLHPHSGAGRILPNSPWNSGTGVIVERVLDVKHPERVKAFAVDTTPAGCVVHALAELLEDGVKPDLCFSGINFGGNVGLHIYASGTVGAALEAASSGIASIAISQQLPDRSARPDTVEGKREMMSTAAEIAKRFAIKILETGMHKTQLCLNVNVPDNATLDTPIRFVDQTLETGITWNFDGSRDRSQPFQPEPSWTREMVFPEGGDLHELLVARNITVTPLAIGIARS